MEWKSPTITKLPCGAGLHRSSMSYNQGTTYSSASSSAPYSSASMSYNQDTTYSSDTTSQELDDTPALSLAGGTDAGAYNQNTSASLSASQWVPTGSDVEGQRYQWWDGVQYTGQFA